VNVWAKRLLVVAAIAAAAEAAMYFRHANAAPFEPPAVVGTWKLDGRAYCVDGVPPDLPKLRGVARATRTCRAQYDGSPRIHVTLFVMPGGPGGGSFDAFQKWPPRQPGKLAFYRGRYFGIVEANGAAPDEIDSFTTSLALILVPGNDWIWRD